MRKYITHSFVLLCVAFATTAQPLQPINILNIKLLAVKTVATKAATTVSFSGTEVKSNISSNTAISIKFNPINSDSASVETTFKKLKMSSESMGQTMDYDSDNPLTSTYKATETLNSFVGSTLKYFINSKGLVTSIDTTHKIAIASKLNVAQLGGLAVGQDCNLFLPISKPVSAGDVWKDSSIVNNTKTVNEYKFKNYQKGLAIIELNSTIVMDGDIEQMGMKMKTKQQGTMKALLTIDPANLVIVNKKTTLSMKGTIAMGNQSFPMQVLTETIESIE